MGAGFVSSRSQGLQRGFERTDSNPGSLYKILNLLGRSVLKRPSLRRNKIEKHTDCQTIRSSVENMIQTHHRRLSVSINRHRHESRANSLYRGIGTEQAPQDFRVRASEHHLGTEPADKLGDGYRAHLYLPRSLGPQGSATRPTMSSNRAISH